MLSFTCGTSGLYYIGNGTRLAKLMFPFFGLQTFRQPSVQFSRSELLDFVHEQDLPKHFGYYFFKLNLNINIESLAKDAKDNVNSEVNSSRSCSLPRIRQSCDRRVCSLRLFQSVRIICQGNIFIQLVQKTKRLNGNIPVTLKAFTPFFTVVISILE